MNTVTDLSALGQLIGDRLANAGAHDTLAQSYGSAFVDHTDLARLTVHGEAQPTQMPDADATRAAVEMAIGTIFDALRESTMDEFAQQLAWGFVNSFHRTAQLAEKREDDAASKLKELARHYDPSEIYAVELEEQQLLTQTLQGCREALETMRDHAAAIYAAETGKPFRAVRGSQVSKSGITASTIEARDYLAARARERREQHAPEAPLVIVSGGQQWHDHEAIWKRLDAIKARIPEMVLGTTGMRKGVDAIAYGWAQARNVKTILFVPSAKNGRRAPFLRNEAMMRHGPIEAIVCEGSGIQANLAERARSAGVPLTYLKLRDQVADRQTA